MPSSLSSDVASKLVGPSDHVVDFYDDFTSGDPESFTTGRMPTYGQNSWIVTGPGYKDPGVGGSTGYTSTVNSHDPFYAIMQMNSGKAPVEVGATFVWTGTETLPTIAIFKDYTHLGYDEMWHANLYPFSLDNVYFAPGYWHDGHVNVQPQESEASWTATGSASGALIPGEAYTVRIYLNDLPNLTETIEDATGTVIATLHVYEPNLPNVLGPWVFFEGGGTDLSWRSAWALADAPSGDNQSSTPLSSLTVRVSEDAYRGDAQFVVLVDGVQIGEAQTATASHSAGEYQDIVISGPFAAHPEHVAIRFINDAYGGSAEADRNLYVEKLTIDGQAFAPAEGENTAGFMVGNAAGLLNDYGRLTFDTHFRDVPTGTTKTAVTVRIAEDAYEGDATFAIFADGVQLGDVQTVTALHASGAFQDITVSGLTGGHPDHVAIRFLNDLYGGSADADRNVYVESIAVDGRTFAATEATNTAGPTIEGVANLWGSQGSLTFDTHAVDTSRLTNPIAVSIQVSEDAYLGDAKFRVMVDGVQLGDLQTATAIRSDGESQWIELAGLTVDDPHRLTVQFVNDAWGGAADLDRNLYVEALTVNGHALDVLSADNDAGFIVDGAAGLLNDSGHLSFLLS